MASTMTTQERPPDVGQSRQTHSQAIARWAGVLVAVIGGLVWVPYVDWVQSMLGPNPSPSPELLSLVAPLALMGAVSALLLRTWYALLIAPGLYLLGYFIVGGVVEVARSAQEYMFGNLVLLGGSGWIYSVPVVVGAGIGTAVASWIAARHHEPAAAHK